MTSSIPGPSGAGVVPVNRTFHYTFNTATRTRGTIAQPVFNFRDVERMNFVRMRVRKVIIPVTFHNVITGVNDVIAMYVTEGGLTGAYTWTIPAGLYSDWAEAVAAGLATTSGRITNPGVTVRSTSVDDYNNKGAIANKKVFVNVSGYGVNHVTFELDHQVHTALTYIGFGGTAESWEGSETECTAWRLCGSTEAGFKSLIGGGGLSAPGKLILNMPAPPDTWQGMRTLNLESSFSFGHMYSTTRERMVPVIDRIPLEIGASGTPLNGNVIEYEPPHQSSWIVSSFSEISQVNFELRDNLNRVVDLHNHDWSVEFEVEEL
jgi:hypothetical protein